MARPAESAMQRIQVGLIGILAVLIFVSIATMVLDRAERQASTGTKAGEVQPSQAEPVAKDEPLAELGVTPAAPEHAQPQDKAAAPQVQPAQ